MENSSTVLKGYIAHQNVSACHQYNLDVREVYAFSYERNVIDGGAAVPYTQFCSAAGQFLRLAIVYGVICIHDVWAHATTFKAIYCMDHYKLFELLSHEGELRNRAFQSIMYVKAASL